MKAVVVVDSEDAVAAAIAMAIRWFFILFGRCYDNGRLRCAALKEYQFLRLASTGVPVRLLAG